MISLFSFRTPPLPPTTPPHVARHAPSPTHTHAPAHTHTRTNTPSENKFGYNNKTQNREFALDVIEETHGFWQKLRSGDRANTEELALA